MLAQMFAGLLDNLANAQVASRCVVVDQDGLVVDVVMANMELPEAQRWQPPPGQKLIASDEAGVGWTYKDGKLLDLRVPVNGDLPLGMPRAQVFSSHNLYGIIHTYEQVGDMLPLHTHDATTNHISIVLKGSFRCFGNPRIEGKVLGPGALEDWPQGEPHGFEALEAGSQMLQLNKRGQPR